MPSILKFRRGNTSISNAFTGREGELFIDLTKKTIVVHDGVTAGGFPLPNTAVSGATGPQGATGATGAQGSAGTNGATGATGSAGSNGATGATGSQGEIGRAHV